jgi:hypothetical protein
MIRNRYLIFPAIILLAFCITPFHSQAQTLVTNSAQSYEKQNKPWPKTVKEAVAQLLSEMSDKDKETIRNTKKEDLIKFHHGWGTGIRNDLGLWQGNKDLIKDTKANHPDDASMVIIEAVWKELQGRK